MSYFIAKVWCRECREAFYWVSAAVGHCDVWHDGETRHLVLIGQVVDDARDDDAQQAKGGRFGDGGLLNEDDSKAADDD